MRRIKSERNTKKLKNSVNDFYYSWIRHPAINERLKDLSNKEVVNMTGKLKNVVEKLYLDLKVEEKYMYYVNLYNLYELILFKTILDMKQLLTHSSIKRLMILFIGCIQV